MPRTSCTRRELLQKVVGGYTATMPFVSGPLAKALASTQEGAKQGHNAALQEPATVNSTPQRFHVTLPERVLPMPEGVSTLRSCPGFKWRGIKGWAWTPEQYLEEIPVMATYKMNFLMNCYTSMWDLEAHGTWARIPAGKVNHWYAPLPVEKKRAYERVVRECRSYGIEFCFSMNPILSSDRLFNYNAPEDLDTLWQHYAWMQALGVRWFNISFDDISEGIDARGQARLLNEVLRRLRAKDPGVQMVFCPTWYAGPNQGQPESMPRLGTGNTPGGLYTKELAATLAPEVYLFWTGPEVCSVTISHDAAQVYKSLANHRLFIWDNYPVNDQNPTLHLGPVEGRDPELANVAEGFMSNPLSPQNQANRIPMLTVADYAWNPQAYDPARSIGQSLAHLGRNPEERSVLRELVELYPGRLVDGDLSTGWNSLRHRFRAILDSGSQQAAKDLVAHASDVSQTMAKCFRDRFALARKVLDEDVQAMRLEYSKKYAVTS